MEAPVVTQEPTETCPWCRETKPLSEWYGKAGPGKGWSPREGPVVCADCREKDPPSADETMAKIPMVQRKILKALMGGANFHDAARAAGVSLSYPGNLLRGRDNRNGGLAMREAFQSLLEMEGLDIFSIARQTRILFHAQKPLWNPKEERWDWFPDNNTQISALRHLTKLANLDPPKEGPGGTGGGAPIVVNIQTNLGDKGPGDPPGTFTIEVAKEPAQVEAGEG